MKLSNRYVIKWNNLFLQTIPSKILNKIGLSLDFFVYLKRPKYC